MGVDLIGNFSSYDVFTYQIVTFCQVYSSIDSFFPFGYRASALTFCPILEDL